MSAIPPLATIPWKDLKVEKPPIGRGGFGLVYKGTWGARTVAIKEVDSELADEFDKEAALMAQCQDMRIVQLLGISKEPERYALVLEYVEGGTLYDALRDASVDLAWNPVRWQIAEDICRGVAYLHDEKRSITHCDLKSSNVLLTSQLRAKICDFGISKIRLHHTIRTLRPLVGTPGWLAPEVLRGQAHSQKSDVYALGKIFWEIASRKKPKSLFPETIDQWDGKQEEIPAACPRGYQMLIQHCWAIVPQERPTAAFAVKLLKIAKTMTIFGKAEWERFFGDIGEEPPLPQDIHQILNSRCPFWPEQSVYKTHILILIPQTINGKPFTLDCLQELIQHPKEGSSLNFVNYYEDFKQRFGTLTAPPSHWILMTRKVIPESRGKSATHLPPIASGYEVPLLLEATTSILTTYYAKGEKIYGQEPWTYTYCQEQEGQSACGGFDPLHGLHVYHYNTEHPTRGFAVVRKLTHTKIPMQPTALAPSSPQLAPSAPQGNPPAPSSPAPAPKPVPAPSPVLSPAAVRAPVTPAIPAMAFGKAQWERFFGDVGVEPVLPANIEDILNSPCPFWSGKKVHETHLLTLVPQTVGGKPLTLDRLGELIQHPKQGTATKYHYYYDELKKQYGSIPVKASHWVLMTSDVIPDSRSKSYAEQQQLVTRGGDGYAVPMLLDAATSILMAYFATGKRLYSEDPYTDARCQEKVGQYQSVAGGFGRSGLEVGNSIFDSDVIGVAGLRKF